MTRSATPGEPETEAGRMLVAWIRTHGAVQRPGITAAESILAIEAEARAESSAEMERLRAALLHLAMRRHDHSDGCDGCLGVQRETRAALGDSR